MNESETARKAMGMSQSKHDEERDRIIGMWDTISFTCGACGEEKTLPSAPYVHRERGVRGQFRADIAAISLEGNILGTCG